MSSYFKGILIGMSIVIGSLILMGYTSSGSEAGTYQLQSGSYDVFNTNNGRVVDLSFTQENGLFKINTKTGQVSHLMGYVNEDSKFTYIWGDR